MESRSAPRTFGATLLAAWLFALPALAGQPGPVRPVPEAAPDPQQEKTGP